MLVLHGHTCPQDSSGSCDEFYTSACVRERVWEGMEGGCGRGSRGRERVGGDEGRERVGGDEGSGRV